MIFSSAIILLTTFICIGPSYCSFSAVYDYVEKSFIRLYKHDDIINIVKNKTDANELTIIHSFDHNMTVMLLKMMAKNDDIKVAEDEGQIIADPIFGNVIVLKGDKKKEAKKFLIDYFGHPSKNIRLYRKYETMLNFVKSYTKSPHSTTFPTFPPLIPEYIY